MGIGGRRKARWREKGVEEEVGGGVLHVTPTSHLPLSDCVPGSNTFAFKAKSKLLIETHLEMHCSAIN